METALAKSELLKGLAPEQAERIAELATNTTWKDGSELFKVGDYAQHLYVVLNREVELHMQVPEWWGIEAAPEGLHGEGGANDRLVGARGALRPPAQRRESGSLWRCELRKASQR